MSSENKCINYKKMRFQLPNKKFWQLLYQVTEEFVTVHRTVNIEAAD